MKSSIELVESTQPLETNQNNQLQPRLLLIEQDHYLSQAFLANVNEPSYQITSMSKTSGDKPDLKDYFLDHNPDMIVINVGFDDSSTLLLIRDIRTVFHGLLVVVSNQNCEQEQIDAFKLGADDYLFKTNDSRILMLRIAALFRRQSDKVNQVELASLTVGEVSLQPKSQKCFVSGTLARLTTFEFNLLKLLLEHQGQILSREQLYFKLLSRNYNGVERTLDVRMSQLREKLMSAGMQKNPIETIWGQGYMFS
jgi:DNA-binding response OmpR family regulator